MNRIKFVFSASLIIFILVATGCTHHYYGPNSVNVPLLRKAKDLNLSGAFSTADEASGFEFQSGYAFSKHIGGMVNFYSATGSKTSSGNNANLTIEKGNGVLGEIGVGYFTPLKNEEWIFEIYGGAGRGRVYNQYQQNEFSKVDLAKIFVQPAIGYKNTRGTIEAAIASRFSMIDFSINAATVNANNNLFDFNQIQDIRNNSNIVFFEPSFIFRAGSEKVKLQLQMTGSRSLSQKQFYTQPLNSSIGVVFIIGKAQKK